MYQGFYNLASGMLTQSRNLTTISNNMVNLQTPGYKNETMTSTTFKEAMLYRTGKYNKENPTQLATLSKIRSADQVHINYNQGTLYQTDGIYDFALEGKGFFCIETPQGVQYTRNGSFSVDSEGYLILNESGRVLNKDGQPIHIGNENFTVDSQGHITAEIKSQSDDSSGDSSSTTEDYGTLKVVDFADYTQLHKEDNGLFSTTQTETTPSASDVGIQWKTLEKSNVDMVEEMTAMMSSQRALQSAAQSLKMYDQIMSRAVSDVGKL